MSDSSPSQQSRLKRLLEQAKPATSDTPSSAQESVGDSGREEDQQDLNEQHPASVSESDQEPTDQELEEAVGSELDRRLEMYEELRAAQMEKARQEQAEQAASPTTGGGGGPNVGESSEEDDEPTWEKQDPIDRLEDRDMGPSRMRRWGRHALVGATVGAVMTMTMFVRDFNESLELDCPPEAPATTAPASGHQEAFGPVADIFEASAGHALQIYRSDRGEDFKKGAQIAHRMLVDQSRTIIKDPQARAAMVASSLEWARHQPDQDFIRYTGDLLEFPGAATDSRVAQHLAPLYASLHADGTTNPEVMENNPNIARSMRYMAKINEEHAGTECHVLPTGGFTPQMHERFQKAFQQVEANRPNVSSEFARGFNETLEQARNELSRRAPTQTQSSQAPVR